MPTSRAIFIMQHRDFTLKKSRTLEMYDKKMKCQFMEGFSHIYFNKILHKQKTCRHVLL